MTNTFKPYLNKTPMMRGKLYPAFSKDDVIRKIANYRVYCRNMPPAEPGRESDWDRVYSLNMPPADLERELDWVSARCSWSGGAYGEHERFNFAKSLMGDVVDSGATWMFSDLQDAV